MKLVPGKWHDFSCVVDAPLGGRGTNPWVSRRSNQCNYGVGFRGLALLALVS